MAQPNWRVLCPEYKEGIHMIAHKLGRILTGTPYYEDHVVDIIGYTTLMRLFAEQHNMALSQMGVTTSDPINGPE
jgi:penicillin V acylase-like amidase (Ntn superfamily)